MTLQLQDLPNEVLCNIAAFSDSATLFSIRLTNRHLNDIAQDSHRAVKFCVRETNLSEASFEKLKIYATFPHIARHIQHLRIRPGYHQNWLAHQNQNEWGSTQDYPPKVALERQLLQFLGPFLSRCPIRTISALESKEKSDIHNNARSIDPSCVLIFIIQLLSTNKLPNLNDIQITAIKYDVYATSHLNTVYNHLGNPTRFHIAHPDFQKGLERLRKLHLTVPATYGSLDWLVELVSQSYNLEDLLISPDRDSSLSHALFMRLIGARVTEERVLSHLKKVQIINAHTSMSALVRFLKITKNTLSFLKLGKIGISDEGYFQKQGMLDPENTRQPHVPIQDGAPGYEQLLDALIDFMELRYLKLYNLQRRHDSHYQVMLFEEVDPKDSDIMPYPKLKHCAADSSTVAYEGDNMNLALRSIIKLMKVRRPY